MVVPQSPSEPGGYSKLKQKSSPVLKKKLFRKKPMAAQRQWKTAKRVKPKIIPTMQLKFNNSREKPKQENLPRTEVKITNSEKRITCYNKTVEKSCASPRLRLCSSHLSAKDIADELLASLPSKFPSFVKPMLRSHVTGGFWLGLPKDFCSRHLTKKDENVVLVDESEEEYTAKYLVEKNGLSGGWRGFSIAHKLLEGDVLVFQLIKSSKFKVYIVRANGLTETDGVSSLLTLDNQAKSSIVNVNEEIEDGKNFETAELHYVGTPTNNSRQDQLSRENNDLNLEVLDPSTKFSESVMKGSESFNVIWNGLVIDSEIPHHIRREYYQLCSSQDSFLHDRLVKVIDGKMAASIISETVKCADAIRAAKLNTTSRDYLESWDKTLKGFEEMGMAVGFLRAHIKKLVSVSLPCELGEKIKSKTAERVQVEKEVRNLETKLSNVKQVIETLDAEIGVLKVQNKNLQQTFQEKAAEPW